MNVSHRGVEEHSAECCVIFTAGESHRLFYLFPPIGRHPAREGRRIRLAGEKERERESGSSNPDGVFKATPIAVEKHAVCNRESGSGGTVCIT